MNCRATRQRIKRWLVTALRPQTMFHKPSARTVATARSAKWPDSRTARRAHCVKDGPDLIADIEAACLRRRIPNQPGGKRRTSGPGEDCGQETTGVSYNSYFGAAAHSEALVAALTVREAYPSQRRAEHGHCPVIPEIFGCQKSRI